MLSPQLYTFSQHSIDFQIGFSRFFVLMLNIRSFWEENDDEK